MKLTYSYDSEKKLTTETWVIYVDDKKGEMAFSTSVI